METCQGLSKPVSGEKATRKGGFLVCGDFDCWLGMLLGVAVRGGCPHLPPPTEALKTPLSVWRLLLVLIAQYCLHLFL